MKKIEIESLSELPKVAEAVLGELRGRSVVLFRGPMGAGKTTLISRSGRRGYGDKSDVCVGEPVRG